MQQIKVNHTSQRAATEGRWRTNGVCWRDTWVFHSQKNSNFLLWVTNSENRKLNIISTRGLYTYKHDTWRVSLKTRINLPVHHFNTYRNETWNQTYVKSKDTHKAIQSQSTILIIILTWCFFCDSIRVINAHMYAACKCTHVHVFMGKLISDEANTVQRPKHHWCLSLNIIFLALLWDWSWPSPHFSLLFRHLQEFFFFPLAWG